jgi:hypothetical protein
MSYNDMYIDYNQQYNSNPALNNQYMQGYQQSSPYMNGSNNYGNSLPIGEDYMQQEEEWEREGLLDPLWEKQQRKVKKNESSEELKF